MLKREMTSNAALGYVTEGPEAPVHTLSISWEDAGKTAINWIALRLCRRWRLSARYNRGSDTAILKLAGQGKSTPVAPARSWGGGQSQLCAIPAFQAEWEIDAWGVSFFMAGARRNGFFLLLPATNMEISTNLTPIVAFLRKGGD